MPSDQTPRSDGLARDGFVLRYRTCDPEARLGVPSGRFTNASAASSLVLAILSMAIVYGAVFALRDRAGFAMAWEYLTGFAGIPIPMAFLASWAISILVLKSLKIRAQRTALRLRFMPSDPGFTVSSATV